MLKFAEKEAGWYAETLTADQTGVFTEQALDEELRLLQELHGEDYGKSLWLQEYFASFDAAIPGSIWGDCVDKAQQSGRILDFPILHEVPVDTAFDLGRTDDTAIWFRQLVGTSINIFDHHASNGKDVQFYVDLLLNKRKEHEITYGTHWLPHDARPRTLASGGKSILQQFQEAAQVHHELGRFGILPRLDVQEGIQAARKTFPFCRFHKARCEKGLNSLRQYHREWDDEKKVFLANPAHDWSSHDADAFRYLSLSWKFQRPDQPDSPLMDKLTAGNPTRQTFGELLKRHLNRKRNEREMVA
jgi:phage terminase large subunit